MEIAACIDFGMETGDASRFKACTLVDAHVHIHPCFPLEPFFDGALENFRKAARGAANGCLLLAEIAGSHWLREARATTVGAWTLAPTGEDDSLLARRSTGESLVVVAGRQIVVHERLEVLALGKDADIPDGLPLDEALRLVRDSGALPVLPWGFGKWSGRRGALVAATLARPGGELYLGDISNRLQLAGVPRLLRKAGERGMLVLPGSDPLPFPNHAGRAGSFGFVLEGALDPLRPAEDLLRRVRALRERPHAYGRGETLPRFLHAQASLQLRQVSA